MIELPLGWGGFALAATAVISGYLIFAITGFGAALITVPILSHILPLTVVLPLAVLLDVGASLVVGVRLRHDARWRELAWMVPFSLAGAVLGVTLLVALPRQAGLVALGAFVFAYGAYSLRRPRTGPPVSGAWAPVAGVVGGATGTLFGIGAPPYAIYLSRRIAEAGAMRATLSTMVLFSTGIRLTVFAAAGLILGDRLALFALLFPFALAGLWAGNRIHVSLTRERVLAAIGALLMLAGASLVVRALGQG